VLACFGVVTVVYGVGQTIYAILAWEDVGIAILRGIGYLVISIAVFEVAKYFVEEEVVRRRQMRTPTDARRSLTNFISTISIAIFLEGLVIVFYVSQNDVAGLIYPSILLLTATAMILGLGAGRPSRKGRGRAPAEIAENETLTLTRQAAFRFGCRSLRLISVSAIWIALSAAPLRRLSDTHQRARPFGTVLSSRIRET
jgi:xanthine/uracil/vitamin C permease (AzgA family)